MTPCERVRADAAGLAALPAGDAERVEAFSHARECPACARALDEAERLLAVVGDAFLGAAAAGDGAASPSRADALGAAPRAIVAELRREARRRMVASVLAVSAAFVLAAALARHRSPARQDWAIALGLAASATALGAASRHSPTAVIAAAPVAAALGVVLAAGGAGALEVGQGVDCLLTEAACASAAVLAAWLALRRGSSVLAPRAVAAGAAAGGLGGAAALQLTCSAHAALSHALVFHAAGVVVVSVGSVAAWRAFSRGARA